jgi:hypothetical protein
METTGQKKQRVRMGSLRPRYSFVLNPYVRERFTKCPTCDTPTRVRKMPLVIHIADLNAPRLVLLNKTCRLCLACETLIVDRGELERALIAAGPATIKETGYVVLGTIDRRTWRQGLVGDAPPLADIREHMADFKKYLKVHVVPAHWEVSTGKTG